MKAEKLAGLKPERVYDYFEKLCSIPHGSFNCGPICDYLESFAQGQGLRYIRDEINNLIIFKDGTAGYEDHEPVILQGHMDMVCQKDDGVCIDMDTQPIDVTHDGTFVFAKGDNAFAWMLYSLLGGGVVFGAIFMATDYATSPVTPKGQILYGIGCGVLTVIFRYFGLFPEGVTYAILLMNAVVWILDFYTAPRRFGYQKGGKHEN